MKNFFKFNLLMILILISFGIKSQNPCTLANYGSTYILSWGQLVFESNDIENSWDGTKDGNPFNQGDFVYKITATMSSGKKINETGNVTLIR